MVKKNVNKAFSLSDIDVRAKLNNQTFAMIVG